jgi:hypothetical protein
VRNPLAAAGAAGFPAAMSGDGPAPAFTVFRFTLEHRPGLGPTQRTADCGRFESVEEAFGRAQALAGRAFRGLQGGGGGAAPTLVDTEWGYDLRLGPLTVDRFWVHEARGRCGS